MSPDDLARTFRTGMYALEAGGATVTGELPLYLFAGIHPEPGETITYTVPITLQISRRSVD